jgi:hypothetical protein
VSENIKPFNNSKTDEINVLGIVKFVVAAYAVLYIFYMSIRKTS